MSNLKVRQDDWSIQITADGSPRFFVRVDTSVRDSSIVVFSDFILSEQDDLRAVDALSLVREAGFSSSVPKNFVFDNIYPSYEGGADRGELVRRHDQILRVVRAFAERQGLRVADALLEPKNGGFQSVVIFT